MLSVQVEVFWVVMLCSVAVGYHYVIGPCCLHLQGEDGGSEVLQNVGIILQHYTVSQHIRP